MKASDGELIAAITNALEARYPNTDHVHFCLSYEEDEGDGEMVNVTVLVEVLDRSENTIISTKKTNADVRAVLVDVARDVISRLDPITDAHNALSHLLHIPVEPA